MSRTPCRELAADPPSEAETLFCFPPLVSEKTKLLCLGSFPGAASLAAQQYYAHPQNHFWPIMQAIWPTIPMAKDYASRCDWLQERGVGLWDVYASCSREGSLDRAIRNAVVNDFASLQARCPKLQLIAHNGGESFRYAKVVRASLGQPHFPLIKLPSTSPANASWSFARKLAAWQKAVQSAGLL
ncbi:MAG: DNA-deoxyinosine glycosylase [Polyangia bacterium]